MLRGTLSKYDMRSIFLKILYMVVTRRSILEISIVNEEKKQTKHSTMQVPEFKG